MSIIKIIKNEQEHNEALAELERLIDARPSADSPDAEKLQVLALLIEKYEQENFPEKLPSPIAAIQFRMEQLGLKPVDLEPYIGSISRVSELLSGKRPLTSKMIRSLEAGLNIPSQALLGVQIDNLDKMIETWPGKLAKLMEERDYFTDCPKSSLGDKLRFLFKHSSMESAAPALLRQSNHRLSPITDEYAQIAWSARILSQATQIQCAKFEHRIISHDFMRSIARLSSKENGPLQAQTVLAEHGIRLIIEPHLPKTRLDGAVLQAKTGYPVIGMTLRYDRLDNFWFTLMHELAHIALHYDNQGTQFLDEFGLKGMVISTEEKEADALASEILVPQEKWDISPAKITPIPMAAQQLAEELGVDISIIAGKIRFETGSWGQLSAVTKKKTVRQFFPCLTWESKP